MKQINIILAVLFFITGCKAEKAVDGTDTTLNKKDYLIEVQEMPQPVGGVQAIMQNVKYPEEAKKSGIQGKVVVQAFVDEKGGVSGTEILKSDDKKLEQAAVDAVRMTKFTPGINEGKPVKTQIVIPIVFKLGDSKEEKNKYPEYSDELDEYPMPAGGMETLGKNIVYPETERKNGIQGQVLVLVLVSEKGEVVKTEITTGVTDGLNKAAIDAIHKTKFLPGKKEGKAVKSQITIPVVFKLN